MEIMHKDNKKDLYLIAFTGTYMALSAFSFWLLWKDTFVETVLLFSFAAAELAMVKSRKLVAIFILCSLGGFFIEATAIYLGAWKYAATSFFQIPLWIMPAWGNVGIFVVTFYKLFGKIKWLEK